MTQQTPEEPYPQVDTGSSAHEEEVAEHEEGGAGGEMPFDEGVAGEERRPSSEEDLAADRSPERREQGPA